MTVRFLRSLLRSCATTWTLAALLIAAPAAHAEVSAADPIDAGMRACAARADRSSTAGQVQCMDNARIGWMAAPEFAFAYLGAAAFLLLCELYERRELRRPS